MEEMVFEVLLYLLVCDSSRALQPDLIEGPFEPHGKGRTLLMVALGDFIEVLHENIKQHHSAKNNLAISTVAPLREHTILSLTTDSG